MDKFMEALEVELLAPPDTLPVERPKQEFSIQTEEQAAWVLSKHAAINAKRDLLKKQFDAMNAEIDANERFLEWRFGKQLEGWARQNLPSGKKSVKLLTGTLAFRKVSESLEVVDEAALMSWAQGDCPEAYKVKMVETIDKKVVKEHWKKTGEIPPGCDIKPESESFSIS